MKTDATYQRSGETLKVDGEGNFNSSTTNNERLRLENTLDYAESIVHRTLHFIAVKVIRTTKNNRGSRARFGSASAEKEIVIQRGKKTLWDIT